MIQVIDSFQYARLTYNITGRLSLSQVDFQHDRLLSNMTGNIQKYYVAFHCGRKEAF